ncbi:hypothetical protein HNP86_001959 [Methanococcus maripaludis]|uniref:Uncharacterized protein n=1 Tax=Methanococcus maripaludis TaxID=39152 RepID=A0A7J9NVU0_METMI|nr:hypothetical protein [Methanococcus maripaludis]MBA2851800.1 hypothetical protein [Methanococcus maripaludis]
MMTFLAQYGGIVIDYNANKLEAYRYKITTTDPFAANKKRVGQGATLREACEHILTGIHSTYTSIRDNTSNVVSRIEGMKQ